MAVVRWGRADFEGTVPTGVHVRWGRADFEGVAAVVLAAIPNQSQVEPESLVTTTTTVTSGQTADSWTWRRISGPAVSLEGTAGSMSFRAPSTMPPAGATVVLGVTATAGGITSPERTVTISVLPQGQWRYSAGVWLGKRPLVPVPSSLFGDTFGDTF